MSVPIFDIGNNKATSSPMTEERQEAIAEPVTEGNEGLDAFKVGSN